MSQTILGQWDPNVERVILIFDELQSSSHDIICKDISLPEGYSVETGWRGESTPTVWAELVCDTFGESAASFWTAEKFVDCFSSQEQQFDKKNGIFFILYKGEVVGSAFAWLDNVPTPERPVKNGRVHFVCVRSAHRRKGLASKLMQCVLRYHRSQGRQAAALRTEVFRDTAIAMYEKLGFRRGTVDEMFH